MPLAKKSNNRGDHQVMAVNRHNSRTNPAEGESRQELCGYLAVPKPNVATRRDKATWAGKARLPANPAIFGIGTPLARMAGEETKGLTVKHVILSFIRNESGAAAAEYALILAIVGAGIAVAASNLGTAISTAINTAQSKI